MNNTTPTQDDELLTPAQAAEEAKCSVETIRAVYRAGALRAFQPNPHGHVKIARSDLYAWLGRPAARNAEPALEDTDWSIPADGADPGQDLIVQDELTLFLPVQASRLSEFFDAKTRQGR